MRALPDMVSRWLPGDYVSLGTDGYGRSDTREALRAFFEIDAAAIAASTMSSLARAGAVKPAAAAKAIRDLGLDPERINPVESI
jgi:pyruvate dehydrogenase E1 component